MTKKSDDPETGQVHCWGINLRDYFAAKAMQGMLSTDQGFSMSINTIAQSAVMQADAMLEALEVMP